MDSTHSGFKGDELQDHLYCENPSKDHVEDIHGVVKQMRLTIVLKDQTSVFNGKVNLYADDLVVYEENSPG